MPGRYEHSVLNTYGAEDDYDMDAILDGPERANVRRESPASRL